MKYIKKRVGYWLGMVVTLLFVGWALMKFDFVEVGKALGQANYLWALPAGAIEVLSIYMRALRWKYFLAPIKPVSTRDSFMATSIGFFANMVLPARLGEFVRAWLIAKKASISKSAALGTVVIERAIDGLCVVAMIAAVLMFTEPPEGQEEYWEVFKATGYFIAGFYLAVFTILFLFHKRVGWVEWLLDFSIGILPEHLGSRIKSIFESFRSGFAFLESGRHIVAIFLWSVVFWTMLGGLNLMFFYAFGLYDLPFIATYLVLVAQIIGSMAPAAPGFVGPYHAATMAALFFYGVDSELGLSIAIVMHATMFFTNTAPGVVFLWLEKMSFTDIKEKAEED